MKKHNGFKTFNKLLLFIPLIFLYYLNIPYYFSYLFNNFIFYLFSLITIIILIKNEEYIYAIYTIILIYILITKFNHSNINYHKDNEKTRTKNMISYNTNLTETSVEEDIIKKIKKNLLNTPSKKNFKLKKC